MNRLQALGVGAHVLSEWLGDGAQPVQQATAEYRSTACVHGNLGEKCPHNFEGDWFNKLTGAIVATIMQQRRAKVALGLHVKEEDQLHFCSICQCHLPTKVHVPIQYLEGHTPDDVWRELPDYCWMRKETGR